MKTNLFWGYREWMHRTGIAQCLGMLVLFTACDKPAAKPEIKADVPAKEASPSSVATEGTTGEATGRVTTPSGPSNGELNSEPKSETSLAKANRLNSVDRYLRAPKLTELKLPTFPGAHAIWGATGRDNFGNMYFGVAAYGVDNPSAHLFRYSPGQGAVEDLGSVNEKLAALGVRRVDPFDETQMKIHSKIFHAADGLIYFSTQDEQEEAGDGSRNALFGGRLFSMDPKTLEWKSLLTTPEGLIATSCSGRYVSALGYFGSVIYQYDTINKTVRSKHVGTVGGHVPRNFFMDNRHHTYAIRLEEYSGAEKVGVDAVGDKTVRASLVEFSEDLTEISATPLEDYRATLDLDSHGMTAYCHTSTGIVFMTHSGMLWHVSVGVDQSPSSVKRLGWFHPDGSCYAASLFCPTGKRYVMGFADQANPRFGWVVYDLERKESFVLDMPLESQQLLSQDGLLVYGCDTLDDDGNAYVVGWKKVPGGYGPYVFQLSWH